AHAAIGRPRVRIKQDLKGAALARTVVDDAFLLFGLTLPNEVAVSAFPRRAHAIDIQKLLHPRRDLVPFGEPGEPLAREVVLSLHPLLDLGGLFILEPAIRIEDLRAEEHILCTFGACCGISGGPARYRAFHSGLRCWGDRRLGVFGSTLRRFR